MLDRSSHGSLSYSNFFLSYSPTDFGIPPLIFQYYNSSSYWNPTVFNLALLKRTIPVSREFNSLIAAMLKLRLYIAIVTPRVNRLVNTLPYRSYRPLTTHSATRPNLPPALDFFFVIAGCHVPDPGCHVPDNSSISDL